jgi:hydroxymethylbilane synthase
MRKLRLGTRKSKLAILQANIVADKLKSDLKIESEIIHITTSGDKNIYPLYDIGGKALFIKELEEALLDNAIDIAVHSLKDVPGIIPEEFTIAAMLERDDPRDVLISKIAKK